MGLFGKSFDEKVDEAMNAVRAKKLVEKLDAKVDGKVVTLTGVAKSVDAKTKAMVAFNELVETENTINQILVDDNAPTVPVGSKTAPSGPRMTSGPVPSSQRVHVVAKGDTLSQLAKTYYGNAGSYMKIFNANTDVLKDPDEIQVGQRLRIPE